MSCLGDGSNAAGKTGDAGYVQTIRFRAIKNQSRSTRRVCWTHPRAHRLASREPRDSCSFFLPAACETASSITGFSLFQQALPPTPPFHPPPLGPSHYPWSLYHLFFYYLPPSHLFGPLYRVLGIYPSVFPIPLSTTTCTLSLMTRRNLAG